MKLKNKYKPVSPFRAIIEHFMSVHGVHENGKKFLINFVKEQSQVFKALKRKGGDVAVIFEFLALVWEDEYHWRDYRLEYPDAEEEDFFTVRKFRKNRLVDVDVDELPASLTKQLERMRKKLSLTNNPFPRKGRLTATYELEVPYQNEKYVLTYTQQQFPGNESEKSHLKGRKADWQSNLGMYILYRYFKRLGFKVKDTEQAIADMVNGFSFISFREGGRLSPDNVRKRIQWLKRDEILVNKVTELEKKFLTEDGLRWAGPT